MINIALFGASSHIAIDLVTELSILCKYKFYLFTRTPEVVKSYISEFDCINYMGDYSNFELSQPYDVIINFVGPGNSESAMTMGEQIIDLVLHFDELALWYIQNNPNCKYIFISSGAVYGGDFKSPVYTDTPATLNLKNHDFSDWYSISKFFAETKHRQLQSKNIVDVRLFNYINDLDLVVRKSFLSDIYSSIKQGSVLKVSPENIYRDFITRYDFSIIVQKIIDNAGFNGAIDCYTIAPIDKHSLLEEMNACFGLKYEYCDEYGAVSFGKNKIHYYSLDRTAEKIGYMPKFDSLNGILNAFYKSTVIKVSN